MVIPTITFANSSSVSDYVPGRLTGRDLLRLEVKEQNAIADACGVVRLGNLERHEAAIRGDHWI